MDVEEITQLLTAAAAGDSAAIVQVFESVDPPCQLRRLDLAIWRSRG